MTSLPKIAAPLLVLTAFSAQSHAAVTLETRFLLQYPTGTGTNGLSVTPVSSPGFAAGTNFRVSVQYRLRNDDPAVIPLGLSSLKFDIVSSGGAGGSTQRAQLFGVASGVTGQARGEAYALDPAAYGYPGSGAGPTPADYRYGLHAAFRSGLSDPDGTGPLGPNDDSSNGTFANGHVTGVRAQSDSATVFQNPTTTVGGALWTDWHNLYSFQFQHSGVSGTKTFMFTPRTDSGDLSPTFRWRSLGDGGVPVVGTQFLNASAAVLLPYETSPPTVTPNNQFQVMSNGTSAPDLNGALIGIVTDSEAITPAQCSVAVMGAAPFNAPSFSFVQINANTIQVLITWELANQDLVSGPGSFMVKLTANDGISPATQGTAIVAFVPAPGALALLGVGGLAVGLRRRQA